MWRVGRSGLRGRPKLGTLKAADARDIALDLKFAQVHCCGPRMIADRQRGRCDGRNKPESGTQENQPGVPAKNDNEYRGERAILLIGFATHPLRRVSMCLPGEPILKYGNVAVPILSGLHCCARI